MNVFWRDFGLYGLSMALSPNLISEMIQDILYGVCHVASGMPFGASKAKNECANINVFGLIEI